MTDEINTTAEVVEVIEDTPVDVKGLIVVEQLPVIVERLQEIKSVIEDKVERAMALEATEDNKKALKEMRAELNRDFKELENARKEVKKKINEPYEKFIAIYNECVPNVYNPAISSLGSKIDAIELIQKQQKEKAITEYFNESCLAHNIDFVTLADIGITINLSSSVPKAKKAIDDFLNRVASEVVLIESQEFKDEIFVEYKKCFSVSQAINTVNLRHKAIDEEARRRAEAEQRELENAERIANVENAMVEPDYNSDNEVIGNEFEIFGPTEQEIPESEQITMPDVPVAQPTRYKAKLEVEGTVDDFKAMKELFGERGMTYEQFK